MQFGCWRGLSVSRPERGWHVEQSQFSLQVPWGRCLPWVTGTEENQNLSFSVARWQLSHTCGFHGGSLGISLLGTTPHPCLSSLREVCVSCWSFVPFSCPLLLPQPVLEFFSLFLIGYSGTSWASQERPLFQIVKSVCISVCASQPADNDLVSIFVTLGMSGKKGRLCKRFGCFRNCLLQSPPQITQPSH